jgi:hypothetical protein
MKALLSGAACGATYGQDSVTLRPWITAATTPNYPDMSSLIQGLTIKSAVKNLQTLDAQSDGAIPIQELIELPSTVLDVAVRRSLIGM